MNTANATIIGKTKINGIEWYLPQYTANISQPALLPKQISSKTPTKLNNVERNIFMKVVNTQKLCTFELGTQEGMNIPIWIFVGLLWIIVGQSLNNDTFYRPPVTEAQCSFGTEKYPD